jgi:hypothetical protein
MDALKRVIHEVHRRSLWQVLAIYLVGSWGALQAVQGITQAAGLPDWVPPGALILLLLGLPIVLATAFVQEGIGGDRTKASDAEGSAVSEPNPRTASHAAPAEISPATRPRVLTWRNAALGGVMAFAVLALSVGAYRVMWAKGLGPAASLVAQGTLDERERVVQADFGNVTPDSLLVAGNT